MHRWRPEPSRHQQRAELIAVECDRVRLVVHRGRRTYAAGERSRSRSCVLGPAAGAGILCALIWAAGFATVYAVTCHLACI